MKKLLFLIILTSFINSHGQQIVTLDNIKIQIKKVKIVANSNAFRILKLNDNRLNKLLIKTKISSIDSTKTNLSGFSLLDTVNKIRYRLADYKGYNGFIGSPEINPYVKTAILNKKGRKYLNAPDYNTSMEDLFEIYNINGFVNFELKINFGNKKNPKTSIVYFGESRYKDFTAELFFPILKEFENYVLVLYYKDERISEIKIN